MIRLALSNALLILCFIFTITEVHSKNPDLLTGDFSVNCGSTGTSSSRGGSTWLGDKQPRSLLQLKGSSTASSAIRLATSADPVPHQTARVSSSTFSYALHVNSGQKIIRLHFNPSPYKGFKGFRDLFSVHAGPFTLLSNFSTSISVSMSSITKEFCLNIQENQPLILTFSPETRRSFYTYAFINGIEIISVPASLSYFDGSDVGLQVIGKEYLASVDSETALEIIHRLKIKQDDGDLDNVFPRWAMQKVEKNKSRTWKVPVEVGFRYLIRLHFSELGLKIAEIDGVVYKVLIDGMVAQTNNDILKSEDGDYIILYRDYMMIMRGAKGDAKRDLLISLHSYDELGVGGGVLAGFEVVKMSNHDYSLASPNPLPLVLDSPSIAIQTSGRNTILTVAIVVISIFNIIVYKMREMQEASNTEEEIRPSARAEKLCRRFSLVEIQLATRNFSSGLLIGRGGFGLVYKGRIDKEQKTVAIKRSKRNSKQGAREFLTEIEILSELRHINMVSLIGFCCEHKEMILVYEYMPSGTLSDHLYKLARRGMDSTCLTWKQRLNICIGAGQGLHYLHTGHRVIHRDVKASNILLDEDFEAKVSDFGLAKSEDKDKLKSHVSTQVKGTFGYFDPYYMTTQKLTRKSDTYAFGVVLLETLCGRPAVDSTSSEDERILTIWARDKISKGEANQIVDSSLRDEISPNSLEIFVRVAVQCLEDEPDNRPTMSQVVIQLELALMQQDSRNLPVSSNLVDGVSPHVSFKSNEDNASTNRAELSSESSTDVQTVLSVPTKQINSNYFSAGRRDVRKKKSYTTLRFRAWGTFWSRINPIKRKEFIAQSETRAEGITLPSNLCRVFSLDEIKSATQKFNDNYIIGRGGYADVYKGVINGVTCLAIKRMHSSLNHDVHEFISEIEIMTKLRHVNVVSFLGYCNEKGEEILVCEYITRGTLQDHLNNPVHSPLTWKQRLHICLGAAKGLHYLHTGVEQTIIHRDVKSTNILLDEKWEAKICDFGSSKACSSRGDDSYVSTVVMGTFGYLDPEYFNSSRLTVKSDVYSFGVVLFEVLCGRRAVVQGLPEEQINLATWARSCYQDGKLENIIDANVKDQISPECLSEFVRIANACLQLEGTDRPSMRDIVLSLESAIKFQESSEKSLKVNISTVAVEESMAGNTNLFNFDRDQIAAATNNFSPSFIIGHGRFGAIYKAVLPSGKVVAVKKRPSSSEEGLHELKNEMILLPQLRHRNIIKLLGYCMEKEVLLLVHEFIENPSLHYLIDEGKLQHLQWEVRFQMIMGIARGLVYLHHDSGLRVIHGDLNASSILLDLDMHPRISDFDVARKIPESQIKLVESGIKATHGYMPPEYYMYGKLSFKSDVYSFGIILLEIISGKRMFPLYLFVDGPCTFGDFDDLMKRNTKKALDLVYESDGSPFQEDGVLRCIDVACLCLQGNPHQRPLMSSVIKKLEGNEDVISFQP